MQWKKAEAVCTSLCVHGSDDARETSTEFNMPNGVLNTPTGNQGLRVNCGGHG